MDELAGFDFGTLRFRADGSLRDPVRDAPSSETTDLVVLAHGWKNDARQAGDLYGAILGNVRKAAGSVLEADGRKWMAIGVHWPAFTYLPDLTRLPDDDRDDLGGAAQASSDDLSDRTLVELAANFARELDDEADADAFAATVLKAKRGGDPADEFVTRLRGRLSKDTDAGTREEHHDLLELPGSILQEDLRHGGSIPIGMSDQDGDAEPAGGAVSFERMRSGLARWRSGGAAAIARILNQATYFEMKARAGLVGAGLARELSTMVPEGVRVHLVGHSFGGRLVSAAAASDGLRTIASLSLLQAAFSHNGFGAGFGGRKDAVGVFRDVVVEKKVEGPVLVTHTHNDDAVGFFYAVASAVSGDVANKLGGRRWIGGPDDRFGGMGANGAQAMLADELKAFVADGTRPPELSRGKVNNVLVDEVVKDHNDVANEAVGALVWKAIS